MPKFAMTVKEEVRFYRGVFPTVLILVPYTKLSPYRHNIMLMRNGIELFYLFKIKQVFSPSHIQKETWSFKGGGLAGERWLS